MFSVIIPMYNSEKTIVRALDSIKNQTRQELIKEIIVINDGSKDSSYELVEEYATENSDMPIKLINQDNRGVSATRNRGLALSKEEWVAFLDSDDEWIDTKIEIQSELIQRNKDIDFLGGTFVANQRYIFRKINTVIQLTVFQMCIRSFIQPSSVVMKKKIYNEIGGFDEKQSHCEDNNYFGDIAYNYNLFFDPDVRIIYNGGLHPRESIGLSSNWRKMQEGSRKNLKDFKRKGYIGNSFYFLYVFNEIKYIRRLLTNYFKRIKK